MVQLITRLLKELLLSLLLLLLLLVVLVLLLLAVLLLLHKTITCKENSLTSETYPFSEMPRTLLSMKAVSSNGVLCKKLTTMGIPMLFTWFSSSSLALPKALTTVGITAALTSHNFFNCNLKSWYLVTFL